MAVTGSGAEVLLPMSGAHRPVVGAQSKIISMQSKWKLYRIGLHHQRANCGTEKALHTISCFRCVRNYGVSHLFRTLCKKRCWLKELIGLTDWMNKLCWEYFRLPYRILEAHPQEIAWGWKQALPIQDAAEDDSDDETLLLAASMYENKRQTLDNQ